MTNTSIGPQVDRLAAVNALIMAAESKKCFDYKYDKLIAGMRNTSWESEDAEGGKTREIALSGLAVIYYSSL